MVSRLNSVGGTGGKRGPGGGGGQEGCLWLWQRGRGLGEPVRAPALQVLFQGLPGNPEERRPLIQRQRPHGPPRPACGPGGPGGRCWPQYTERCGGLSIGKADGGG